MCIFKASNRDKRKLGKIKSYTATHQQQRTKVIEREKWTGKRYKKIKHCSLVVKFRGNRAQNRNERTLFFADSLAKPNACETMTINSDPNVKTMRNGTVKTKNKYYSIFQTTEFIEGFSTTEILPKYTQIVRAKEIASEWRAHVTERWIRVTL